MIEILCSVLTGAAWGREIVDGQNLGHLFVATDVARFMPEDAFQARLRRLIDDIHTCEPAPGVARLYVPGEIEAETKARREREGIPLTDDIVEELLNLGRKVGEPFPLGSKG